MVWLGCFFIGLVVLYAIKMFKSDLDFKRFEKESLESSNNEFFQENKEEKTVFNNAETKEKSDLKKSIKALEYIQTMENCYDNSKNPLCAALNSNIENFKKTKRLSKQKIEQVLKSKSERV